MTAEGTALSGAGEAPKAELAVAKGVVADTQPGERPTEEREGVGGPFVIVNGDSDGLSDRGSDMSTGPEVDPPSDEEDLPRSNAGPNEEAVGDHGTAGGELGGLDAAVGVSSPNGHGRAAVESEDGVDEGKEERSEDFKAERGELGIASGELGGSDSLAKLGVDHADGDADSAAPAVDSEVNDKETEGEKGAAHVTELHGIASEEQHVEVNAAVTPSGLDDTSMNVESSSTVLESEACGEESKGEQIAAETMEMITDESGASMVNGHHDANMSVDSCVTSTEPASHADEGKQELMEKDGTCGEQDGIDSLHVNKHMNADSGTPASEFEAHADESKGQQIEAPTTVAEVLDGTLDASSSDCDACTYKEPTEEEVVANGHGYTEDSADASGQLEPGVDDGEGEAICGVVVLEEITGNGSEENLHDGDTVVVASSDEEAKHPMQEGIDEVVPAIAGTGLVTRTNSEQIVKDDLVCTGKPESPFVESNGDQKVKVEVAAGDENTMGSDVKRIVEMDTSDSVQTEDLTSAVEDRSIPLHVNSSDEVEEKEVNSQAPAASTSPDEPRSIDLIDNDTLKQSNPVPELESYDHVEAEECNSQEISRTTVDQVTPDVSMEHGTAVTDDVEPRYETDETGDTSHEKYSETAVDQSEPIALNEDKSVTTGDVKLCSASSTTGNKCSSPKNELISPVDEPHSSDVALESGVKAPFADKETCKDIYSENINACNKSSHEAETKCLEVLQPSSIDTVVLEGHKDDDGQAHKDDEKIVKDSSESHVDLDTSNKGDIQVIRPQKNFIIKIPRLAGEEDWARIQDAQVHLDRLTQERDALNNRRKKQKAVFDEHRLKYEAASQEEREARAAHGDKRNDLDGVRSIIGKLNKANSIEEIDDLIARKERTMEHETISLKEEKLFIKEINELKSQRKQLCSNIGSRAEISEVFHQKDHIHEQHKTLKKDSDVLFKNLKSLEENTKKIKKSLDDERAVLKKINDELQIANEVRQKAYENWVQLRGEPARKNKSFFMYKNDRAIAYKYLQNGDMDGLQSYCNNQVENVLEMWNKNDDFRKLYVEANKNSTLRRLGTHDGRKLGPEEDPPVIPSYNFNRKPSNPSPLTVSSPNVPIITSEAALEKPVPVSVPVKEDSFPVLSSPQIAKQAKSKASGSSVQKEITTAPASEREDAKDIEKEKARLVEELEVKRKAEELARREEELRQERAAAEKERLRLEQKVKAKEAEERKKKKAEKAQERAEFKARKEAEMKEKKKAKKDKKTTPADLANGSGEGNSAAIATADTDSNTSENARDTELSAGPRRIARPAVAMRQLNRLQPMPLPLRNRGRRRMRQYILIGVAVAVSLVALLLAVKYIQFPSFKLTSPLN